MMMFNRSVDSLMLYTIGWILFFVTVVESFMGYILVWGNMSYWGASVMINILAMMPLMGPALVSFIWCSSSVILNFAITIHFLLGIMIMLLIIIHILYLHNISSSSPFINSQSSHAMPFFPVFFKDLFVIILLFWFASFNFFFEVESIYGNASNLMPASPQTTPNHILPEWYFLLFYSILSAFPDKLTGALMVIIFFMWFINWNLSCWTLRVAQHFATCNWLLSFLLLNSFCLIPFNLFMSGSSIIVMFLWLPLSIQYLFGLCDHLEFFRFGLSILDMFIFPFINMIYYVYSSIINYVYYSEYMSFNTFFNYSNMYDLLWYGNLIIVIFFVGLFLFMFYYTLLLYKLWKIHFSENSLHAEFTLASSKTAFTLFFREFDFFSTLMVSLGLLFIISYVLLWCLCRWRRVTKHKSFSKFSNVVFSIIIILFYMFLLFI